MNGEEQKSNRVRVVRVIVHEGTDEQVRHTLERSIEGVYCAGGQWVTGYTLRDGEPDDEAVRARLAVLIEARIGSPMSTWDAGVTGTRHDAELLPAARWVRVADELPDEGEIVTAWSEQLRWSAPLEYRAGGWRNPASDRDLKGHPPSHWLKIGGTTAGGER